MRGILLGALGILLLDLSSARAATNEITAQLKGKRDWQISTIMQATSSLHEAQSVEHSADSRLTLSPTYKLSENYRLRATTALVQELDGGRKAGLTNTTLRLARTPWSLNIDHSVIGNLGLRLPTNLEDRKKNSYNGSLLLEPTLVSNWNVGQVDFTTIYVLAMAKNFHSYDRTSRNTANVSYSFSHYLALEKNITSKWIFTLEGDYTTAWTYQNSFRSLFSLGQVLTYEPNSSWSVSIGHSNGGDALRPNGRDYDIALFDENSSVVFASLRTVY